ncbi:MAG: DUF6089 family protein [Sediminibacterium sp.]
MLNRIYILGCCIFLAQLVHGQHLQLIENRGEIGLFAGQASYRGDIAPDKLSYKNSLGAYYKKQYNDYAGFRFNYEQVQLGNKDLLSNNLYAKSRGFSFSRQFHDISLMGEFYFTRFLPGNKGYRFTPYLGIGAGYILESGIGQRNVEMPSIALSDAIPILPFIRSTKGYMHIPVQLGFKFNLSQRWNIFSEAMYRFVHTDELDYIADGQLIQHFSPSVPADTYNYQGSRSGKDQFFSFKGGISYNLIKIYGEEKWKPGKKSKLASLKEKEASQKKPGFFSRLKFKRK